MSFAGLAELSSAQATAGGAAVLLGKHDLAVAVGQAQSIALPDVSVSGLQYYPDGTTGPAAAELTPTEEEALRVCLAMGESALLQGNPPIGAVLLDNKRGLFWGALTVDKTSPTVLGHGEVRAYNQAEPVVGDQLQDCTLVSTAQPCNTCTCPYAEGNIGRIIYAAPRSAIRAVSGLMRERLINMGDLLADGETNTTVIEGHYANQALAAFAVWGQLRRTGTVAG